jgi:cyanophycinase-like exopeptidase
MYRKLALVALASLTPSVAMAQVDCAAYALPAESKLLIESANVGYYSSHSLSAFLPNPDVRRAVIMIHGLSGNAPRYYETLVRSACRAQGVTPVIGIDYGFGH